MDSSEAKALCELTPEQLKCFNALKKAYSKCIKSGVYIHQVLDSFYAFNGDNVCDVDDDPTDGFCTQQIPTPAMKVVCGWADDSHYAHFR